MTEPTADAAATLNEHLDGWCSAMALRFLTANAAEVIAEWTVARQHLQAYGIVHGGVHCGVVETLASIGAALHAMERGQSVVGLENHTSFIRAVREGELLRGRATPLTRGRSTQVWETSITTGDGRLVAKGTVRLMCLQQGSQIGGGPAEGPLRKAEGREGSAGTSAVKPEALGAE